MSWWCTYEFSAGLDLARRGWNFFGGRQILSNNSGEVEVVCQHLDKYGYGRRCFVVETSQTDSLIGAVWERTWHGGVLEIALVLIQIVC